VANLHLLRPVPRMHRFGDNEIVLRDGLFERRSIWQRRMLNVKLVIPTQSGPLDMPRR
jgi:hypothetical protein